MDKRAIGISLILLGLALAALSITLLAIGVYGPVAAVVISFCAAALGWLGVYRLLEATYL